MFKKQLTTEQAHVRKVFERLCNVYQVPNNAALERHLGLSDAFCSTRIKRASLPFEQIYQAAIEQQVSIDQLILGEPVKHVDGNDLLIIKQGVLLSLHQLKASGIINKAQNNEDLERIAKLVSESIENQLANHWNKDKKDSA